MKKILILNEMVNKEITIALFLILLAGCTSINESSTLVASLSKNPTYKNMSVDELHNQLKTKNFVFVDVHIPEQKHINETDAFIPYNDIENQLEGLPKDKNAKIVLYCRTGHMSQIAAEKLAKDGYTNVYNVVGGIVEWNSKGYGK